MILWRKDDAVPLYLVTPAELKEIPDGVELESISGEKVIKGKDYIDDDTRAGYLARGIRDPLNHPEAQLFTKFKLQGR